ncbi:ankyrin repeat domain-containing protein [Blastopirellula sp. JC732]|uniref:Ankyrin repeat domain-containing protein n=1 Tax=Blastopirellula sediminis TaxID=2894196 RepID=A0A9X1SFG5_9BACT|nr:ankyrin repeat domain-containing protein [Blastopirellula sediminis]MCC9609507.1 ankyrin repeat domain-containing protein [Blastopirellula sediminis]MCC9627717.1 ankyrin repeat domain-containing protein [Blastopirellula sediminis]
MPVRKRLFRTLFAFFWLVGLITPALGGDPIIAPIQLSEIDLSAQIDPEPQGGEPLLLWKKPGYEALRAALWHAGNCGTLLANGADPNAQSPEGAPILLYAISHSDERNLEILLRAGADPNGADVHGYTPLLTAIRRDSPEAIRLLLRYGADPLQEIDGKTAIEHARWWKRPYVDLLQRDPNPLQPTPVQVPRRIRKPDSQLGSAAFRVTLGGEALTYSNDSRQIIAGDRFGAIRIFDAQSGEIQNVIAAHSDEVLELATIPNSNIVVSATLRETKFWDLSTSCELMRLRDGGRGLSVSPDGRFLFTGNCLFAMESTSPLRLSQQGRAYPQAGRKVYISWSLFTPDDRYLIFGVQGTYVYIWNLKTDFVRRVGDVKVAEMTSLTWGDLAPHVDIGAANPDDLLVLATDQYAILSASAARLKSFQPILKAEYERPDRAPISEMPRVITCSPNGQYLATMSHLSRINVFDIERKGAPIPLTGPRSMLHAVAASPAGNLIAAGGDDQTVRIWDRITGEQLTEIPTSSFVYSLAFSPEGERLAIGDGGVYQFHLSTGQLDKWGGGGRTVGLSYNSEGDVLFALGFDLNAFHAATGKQIASVTAYDAQQHPIAVTPGNLIFGVALTQSRDETFKLPSAWSFDNEQLTPRSDLFSEEMRRPSTIGGVATTPDGSLLAVLSQGTILLWDLKEKKQVGPPMYGAAYLSADMEFSPDGKRLAATTWSGEVWIWEIPSGRPLLVLDDDVSRIESIAFLPDGSLVTANGTGTVHLWNLPNHLAAE